MCCVCCQAQKSSYFIKKFEPGVFKKTRIGLTTHFLKRHIVVVLHVKEVNNCLTTVSRPDTHNTSLQMPGQFCTKETESEAQLSPKRGVRKVMNSSVSRALCRPQSVQISTGGSVSAEHRWLMYISLNNPYLSRSRCYCMFLTKSPRLCSLSSDRS